MTDRETIAYLLEALEECREQWHSSDCSWTNPEGDDEPVCNCHRAIASQALRDITGNEYEIDGEV